MKISVVTISDLKAYARVENNVEDTLFTAILIGAKEFIKSYTGLDAAGMDLHEDLTIALKVLANEMYEQRQYTVQHDKVNIVIKSILDRHCINFL